MRQEEIQCLSNERLAELCAEQTLLFEIKGKSDGRYCYELIRRAIFGIEGAWDAVDVQYRPWLRRKVARYYQGDLESAEDLVQVSLLAFHRNITPERWHKFPDLKHILQYLNVCVRSRVLNHIRSQTRHCAQQVEFSEYAKIQPSTNTPETKLIDDEWRRQIWDIVQRNCKYPNDRLLIDLLLVYRLKPQQIVERYPDQFPTPDVVYKQKRNLFDRIKRDPGLEGLLEFDPPK